MNVNIKKLATNQLEIEVEIPAAQVESYFELAASELSKNMKVDGFRPGRVPIDIVEKEKGLQALFDQAANFAIQRTFVRAILDNKIEMVGQPDITVSQIARQNPMKYKAIVWIIPEIKLADYKGLKVKKKEIKAEDKEIDDSLKYLQKSRAKLITVNRPAKIGDRIEIDFSTRIGGVEIEGGKSKNHPIILGEGNFIPGFEKELEGMKTGEEKDFIIKAPADWYQKKLANKNLDFSVKINLVQEREIPELSDEFAKSLGNFDSLLNLKKNIAEGILEEKKLKDKERIRMELIEKVALDSEMDIPPALINVELEKMIDELKQHISSFGLDFDVYLSQIKKTIDDLKKEWQDKAKKRVRIGLVLREIAKKEKIDISDSEVLERINETMKNYSGKEKEINKNIDLEALKEYTKNIIINEKAFELLEREANIK